MCDVCDWEDFTERARNVLSLLDDLPDRAADFADGVRSKTEGMIQWVEENEHVTLRMEQALNNMQDAVYRWLD